MGAAGGDEIETLEIVDKVTRAIDPLEAMPVELIGQGASRSSI